MLFYGYDETEDLWYVIDDYGRIEWFYTEDEAKERFLDIEVMHYEDKFDIDFAFQTLSRDSARVYKRLRRPCTITFVRVYV